MLSEKGIYASGAREDILVLIILGSGSSDIYIHVCYQTCVAYVALSAQHTQGLKRKDYIDTCFSSEKGKNLL